MKVKLANRQDRKRLSVVLDGEGSGQQSEDVLVDNQPLEILNESPTEFPGQPAMREIVPIQLNLDENYHQAAPMHQNLEKTYLVTVPMQKNLAHYQAQAMVLDENYQAAPMQQNMETYQVMVPMVQNCQAQSIVPIQQNRIENYQPQAMVPMQLNMDENYQVIIEDDIAAPTGPKRMNLRPQGDRNSAEFPFCTTSQTISVSRGGPDTEKLSAVMNAYGSKRFGRGSCSSTCDHDESFPGIYRIFILNNYTYISGRFT